MRSESEKVKMIFYSSGPPHQCPCQIILSQLMSLRFSMDYFLSSGKPLHRILHILVVSSPAAANGLFSKYLLQISCSDYEIFA